MSMLHLTDAAKITPNAQHATDPVDIPNQISEYLTIGSGFNCDDENLIKGKITVYRSFPVIEDGKTVVKIKELYTKDKRYSITSICDLMGYIAYFNGPQLQLYCFKEEVTEEQIAFLPGHYYTKTMHSLKNYILFLDAHKGFELVRWRPYGMKLIPMAKDTITPDPGCISFLTYGNQMGGAIFDGCGNLKIFDFDAYSIPIDAIPFRSKFYTGKRYEYGGHLVMKDSNTDKTHGHFMWTVSQYGVISFVIPVKEQIRRHLLMAQSTYQKEKHSTGLTHLEFRMGKSKDIREQELINASPRLIIDLDYLSTLLDAPIDVQHYCLKALEGENMSKDFQHGNTESQSYSLTELMWEMNLAARPSVYFE